MTADSLVRAAFASAPVRVIRGALRVAKRKHRAFGRDPHFIIALRRLLIERTK